MATLSGRLAAPFVWTLSTALVGVVALTYLGPKFILVAGLAPATLPRVNATLNGIAVVLLLAAWAAVLRRNIPLHRRLMLTAVAISVLFLVSYVVQHSSFPSVKYGGGLAWLYYPVLLSHILLSVVLVPMALITLVRGLGARYDQHRRIARWTLPLWLYVSITGVMVYLFCAPYY
ncbi:MAG: DUF420 domain-containing protein [Flavobacteriales bacterium]|nr:DUF420 domain-containing protein [Flavobacteriales bacterium]MBP9080578.1 DUF420 domain-containing protein [Flavobacteriales bacterium]